MSTYGTPAHIPDVRMPQITRLFFSEFVRPANTSELLCRVIRGQKSDTGDPLKSCADLHSTTEKVDVTSW